MNSICLIFLRISLVIFNATTKIYFADIKALIGGMLCLPFFFFQTSSAVILISTFSGILMAISLCPETAFFEQF